MSECRILGLEAAEFLRPSTNSVKPFVLVVDSDCHRARELASSLRTFGCYSASSTCGEDALRYVAENDPDAVIVAWDLSDLQGLELARRLKTGSFTPKVILVRDEADWKLLRRTMECGGDELLSRPLSMDQLLRILAPGRGASPKGERMAVSKLQEV